MRRAGSPVQASSFDSRHANLTPAFRKKRAGDGLGRFDRAGIRRSGATHPEEVFEIDAVAAHRDMSRSFIQFFSGRGRVAPTRCRCWPSVEACRRQTR